MVKFWISLLSVSTASAFIEAVQNNGRTAGVQFENQAWVQEQQARSARLLKEWQTNGDANSVCQSPQMALPTCYQVCNMWCWATVTSMTVDYYRGESTCQGLECQVPSLEFGQQCCPYTRSCKGGPSGPNDTATTCNRPGSSTWMANAAQTLTKGSFTTYGALNQTTLDKALNSGRPVMIAVDWTWGGGHTLIIGGCGNGTYYVHDPWGWFKKMPVKWQHLTYGQLLKYPAADDWGIGTWTFSVTWNLEDELGHNKALQRAAAARAASAVVV